MALARKFLAVLIAGALFLAPVGSAMARFNGPQMNTAAEGSPHSLGKAGERSSDHSAENGSHHQTIISTPHASSDHGGEDSSPCDHHKVQEGSPAAGEACDCCDEKQTACAEFCLQKCFGQLCVIDRNRLTRLGGSDRYRLPLTERPPDWAPSPQTPPPRV